MLGGAEHFYGDWLDLVRSVVGQGPVLDVGTSQPFQKEMAALRGRCATPYVCLDVVPSATVDMVGDGQRLPVRTGSAGAVLCSHVLEHVPDPARVVEEVRRVLRPGGSAYFTLLDVWPYHPTEGAYRDYHRFKADAVDLLFGDWAEVRVLQGGGVGQVLVNYAPAGLRGVAQRAANLLDRRVATTLTPVRYVAAVNPG